MTGRRAVRWRREERKKEEEEEEGADFADIKNISIQPQQSAAAAWITACLLLQSQGEDIFLTPLLPLNCLGWWKPQTKQAQVQQRAHTRALQPSEATTRSVNRLPHAEVHALTTGVVAMQPDSGV